MHDVVPPSDVGSVGQAAHAHAVHVLTAMGEDPVLSADALDRYARATEDLHRARHVWQMGGAATVGVSTLRAFEVRQDKLMKELGLTPAARAAIQKRPARAKGQVSSPDKQAPAKLRPAA